MYCSKCGSKNRPHHKFCISCGEKLIPLDLPDRQAPVDSEPAQKESSLTPTEHVPIPYQAASSLNTKKILISIGWGIGIFFGLSALMGLLVCIGKDPYTCNSIARLSGERYGGLMFLISIVLTVIGVKKNWLPGLKNEPAQPSSFYPRTENHISPPTPFEVQSPPSSDGTINYKAILLGVGGGFLGGIIAGILLNIILTVQGQSASMELLGLYLEEHLWLLYAVNIFGGLCLGWVVSRIAKINLSKNLLIASTVFVALSVFTNTELMRNLSWGISPAGELFTKALLPLLAAWASPFLFLFIELR